MRKVPLALLTTDMTLAKPVHYFCNLLLKEGTGNLVRYAESLAKMGITYVYVNDDIGEDIEVVDIIKSETTLKCKTILCSTLNKLQRDGSFEVDILNESINGMVEELLTSQHVLVSLNDLGTTDDSTFNHSINTTIYAMLLGQQLGYSRYNMQKLAIGTLLHDVGKVFVDQKILYKKGRLTVEEKAHINTHTTLGYDALKKNKYLTEDSREISLSHHERLNGIGYPNGLTKNEIPEFVRIAAIADVYEALTADRCYHAKNPNYKAVEIMAHEAVEGLDASLLGLLIKRIAIYPNGSTVRLSTGDYAVVVKQNVTIPYCPVVRVMLNDSGKIIAGETIDLSKKLDMTIVEAEIKELDWSMGSGKIESEEKGETEAEKTVDK